MTLIDDLNLAVNRVVQEIKNTTTVPVDNSMKKENEELKTAINSAIGNLTTVITTSSSNMAEPVVTTTPAPEDHIPS